MARATNSPASRKRRKKVLKYAKGYFGNKSKLFRYAKEAVNPIRAALACPRPPSATAVATIPHFIACIIVQPFRERSEFLPRRQGVHNIPEMKNLDTLPMLKPSTDVCNPYRMAIPENSPD